MKNRGRLTWEVVRAVRASDPSTTTHVLAARYQISQPMISAILRGVVYKDRDYTPVRPPKAKLNWDKVREIRRLRSEGAKLGSIAMQFNVSSVLVHNICKALVWQRDPVQGLALPIEAPRHQRSFIRIDAEQASEIRMLHEQGYRIDWLAARFGVSQGVIRNAIHRVTFSNAA